jgi:WD40 repeat protein/tRNA A-37 threonylcarbamoyl transferase component Bud32
MTPVGRPGSINGNGAANLDAEAGRVFDAYLAELEAGRPADPERLLAAHPNLADRLRACLEVMDWADRLSDGPEVAAGVVLNDFRIVREIGRGGMGIVYEAEQISLGRRVALKVLPFAATLDRNQLIRFRIEAQAAAQLHHTNIVPVFAVGEARGVHFYAMQFIEGQTLHAVIRCVRQAEEAREAQITSDAVVPPWLAHTSIRSQGFIRTIAQLGIQAAEALEYAHSVGIIHRDVKPANLLVDVRGNLWVTDFGLARMQVGSGVTVSGDMVGTLRYMSPEQMLAKREAVDHRTDIYSLGATLYQLLTLRTANGDEDNADVVRQMHSVGPTPLRRLNGAIARDLETIILKAMANDAGERYASARELADDLRRFLDDRPIRARRESSWAHARKWARRHRVPLALASFVLLIASVASGVIVVQQRSNRALERIEHSRSYVGHIVAASYLVEKNRITEAREILTRDLPKPGSDDLRSFPWYHLWRICDYKPTVWPGHSDSAKKPIYHVEFSPRGDIVASSGDDGTVRLWNFETGQLERTLRGHDWDVNWVTFSPDGTKIATGSDDHTVRLWSLTGPDEPITIGSHSNSVLCVLFTSDGKKLISGGSDRQVKVWDIARRRMALSFDAGEVVEGMSLSPDGRTLATAVADGKARLWDTASWQKIREMGSHSQRVQSVAFSHDGKRLAEASRDGTVDVWDVAHGSLVARSQMPAEQSFSQVQCVAFSRDDKTMASCGDDGTVRLWDPSNGNLLQSYRADAERLWCLAFARDAEKLLACGNSGLIRCWDLTNPQDRTVVGLPFREVTSLKFVAGSNRFLVAGWLARDEPDFSVTTYRLEGVRAVQENQLQFPGQFYHGVLSPDGRTLCTLDATFCFALWNSATGELLRKAPKSYYSKSVGAPLGLHFPNNRAFFDHLVTGDDVAMQTIIWNKTTNTLDTRPTYSVPLLHMAEARTSEVADQSAMASSNVVTNQVLSTELKSTVNFQILRYSQDGHLMCGRSGHMVYLFDPGTLRPRGEALGHPTAVTDMDFSPDDRDLASVSEDGTVKLWDTAVRQELQTLRTLRYGGHRLRFSPNVKSLVCISANDKSQTSELIIWHTARPEDSEEEIIHEPKPARSPHQPVVRYR